MRCDRLYIFKFSYFVRIGRRPHVGGEIDLEAIVETDGVIGDCPRAGKVQFSFQPASTGSTIVSLPPGIVNADDGTFFVKPGHSGVAGTAWTPTDPASGWLVAAVSCDLSPCPPNGVCDAIPVDPNPPYTATTPITIFARDLPPLMPEAVAMGGPPGHREATRSLFFGFGVVATQVDTRVTARALRSHPNRSSGQPGTGLSVPSIRLAVAPPPDAHQVLPFRSGILQSTTDFVDREFAGEENGLSNVRRKPEFTQGILRVDWAKDSFGARAAIEIIEEDLSGRRLGGFVVGVANVDSAENVIWL